MSTITQQDVDDGAADLQTLEDVANGASDFGGDGLVHPRLGGDVKTLAKVISDIGTNPTVLNADTTYPDVATGLAATALDGYFSVVVGSLQSAAELYRNVGGVAVLQPGGTIPSDARIVAIEGAISDIVTFGYPEGTIPDGPFPASNSHFVYASPVPHASTSRKVRFNAHANKAGDLELGAYTKTGSSFTRQRFVTIAAADIDVGFQEKLVALEASDGEHLGFKGNNIISYQGAPSINDEGGWYAGGPGETFVDESASTTGSRLGISFDLYSTGTTTLSDLKTAIDATDAKVADLSARHPVGNSNNVFDPLDSQNQLDKYIVATNGLISDLANYAAVGSIPVTAGKTYRLDITAALDIWEIYVHPSAVIAFYNSDDMDGSGSAGSSTWVGGSAIGEDNVTMSDSNRVCTFTVPAGATHFGFTPRRVGSANPEADDFQELLAAVSVTEGLGKKPLSSPASSSIVSDTVLEKVGDYMFIRCPYRPGNDVVYRVNIGYAPGTTSNGVIDFDGVRLILSAEPDDRTAAAWAASSMVINSGGDASPPFKLNGMYLGGGHGIVSQKVTKTAHGKSNVDVGSRYTDGASKVWVLTQVVDADNLTFTGENTGTATRWYLSGGVTGSLTHTSGGTNTATVAPSATVGTQLWPTVQRYFWMALLDDRNIVTEDGVYPAKNIKLIEGYGIPNAASVLDSLTNLVGNTSWPDYTADSIQTQIEVQTTYAWDFTGVCQVTYNTVDIQDYNVNLHGGIQQQAMPLGTDDTLFLYVPRCTTGTLATGQDLTSLATTIYVNDEDFTDATNPPDRFWQMTKRGTEKRHAWIMGYSKLNGVDRTDIDAAFFMPNTSKKMYPLCVDAGHGAVATAGTLREVCAFFGAMDPNRNDLFNAKVLFPDAGKHTLYLETNLTLTNEWVKVHESLIGLPVSQTFTTGLTLKSTVVGPLGVLVDGTGELDAHIG